VKHSEGQGKKVGGRVAAATGGTCVGGAVQRYRASVWFAVRGDARFLSHRDTLRTWERALRRSRAPLRYSQGFNPHVRMSLPLPRSVGMSSQRELLVVELNQSLAEGDWCKRLCRVAPPGLEVLGVEAADVHAPLNAPEEVSYRVRLGEEVELDRLDERIKELEAAAEWLIERPRRGRHPARTIDLCAHVRGLRREGCWLGCTILTGPGGTARMDEVLAALALGGPGVSVEVERVGATYPAALGAGPS